MPQLLEYLGPFSIIRISSHWLMPTVTTSVAMMMWSRVAALNGLARQRRIPSPTDPVGVAHLAEVYYPVNDAVVSARQTLLKSWLLYAVLVVQPALSIAMLVLCAFFCATPIDDGFGLVAILAGVEKESLDLLKGAALSGEVKYQVALDIAVVNAEACTGRPGRIVCALREGRRRAHKQGLGRKLSNDIEFDCRYCSIGNFREMDMFCKKGFPVTYDQVEGNWTSRPLYHT
ncbi:hypothetical protein BJ546DRAFT_977899 [Cryomyces antarcticus]